ncbi:hypothetical protein PSYMO_18788, partial [Pseudomonas amygdali pv. mori str. 301020]
SSGYYTDGCQAFCYCHTATDLCQFFIVEFAHH